MPPRLGEDTPAVAPERETFHPAGVPIENDRSARPQVPNLDRAVQAPGRQLPSIRPEGDARLQPMGTWGQAGRGPEGAQDSGPSEVIPPGRRGTDEPAQKGQCQK